MLSDQCETVTMLQYRPSWPNEKCDTQMLGLFFLEVLLKVFHTHTNNVKFVVRIHSATYCICMI